MDGRWLGLLFTLALLALAGLWVVAMLRLLAEEARSWTRRSGRPGGPGGFDGPAGRDDERWW